MEKLQSKHLLDGTLGPERWEIGQEGWEPAELSMRVDGLPQVMLDRLSELPATGSASRPCGNCCTTISWILFRLERASAILPTVRQYNFLVS